MFQDLITNAITSLLTSFVAFGAVYKFFGEKLFGHLLEGRLQRERSRSEVKLQELKHEQDVKIQAISVEVGHLTDRGKHSNEREYAALSSIWEKYVDAHYATLVGVTSYTQHPDLNKMPDTEVRELLETTELSEKQKDRILNSDDKNRSFSHAINRDISIRRR
jgi:hypothetical protein